MASSARKRKPNQLKGYELQGKKPKTKKAADSITVQSSVETSSADVSAIVKSVSEPAPAPEPAPASIQIDSIPASASVSVAPAPERKVPCACGPRVFK